MEANQITSLVLIIGTVCIATGFGAFPARIYTATNVQEKLDLLAAQPRRWVFSQFLVILGSLIVAAGSFFLVRLFSMSPAILPAGFGGLGFLVGHIFWVWIVGLRIVEPWRQAKNEFPHGTYKLFSILTLLGLAGFGIAFWMQGALRALGAGLFFGALLILGLYLKLNDMPPITYYLLTLIIGLSLLL